MATDLDMPVVERILVQHEGRLKPFDTVARSALLLMRGNQGLDVTPSRWLLDVVMNPEFGKSYQVIRIDHPDVRGILQKEEGKYFSLAEIEPYMEAISEQAVIAQGKESPDSFETAIKELWERITLHVRLSHTFFYPNEDNMLLEIKRFEETLDRVVPLVMAQRLDDISEMDQEILQWFVKRYQFLASAGAFGILEGEWQTVGEGLLQRFGDSKLHPGIHSIAEMVTNYRAKNFDAFNAEVRQFKTSQKASIEVFFNSAQPFFWSAVLYAIAMTVALFRPGRSLLTLAFVIHTIGLFTRMWIEERPPVTNLYSSAIFVGWGAVGISLLLEGLYKNGLSILAGSVVGGTTLIVAHHLSLRGDTIEMMRAVLNSNFWLSTHVVAITIGYSAAFLAGLLACAYVIRPKTEPRKAAGMVYGVICISTLFSFVGTVLGGIWADQSWGRFWGWDPKENGALMIVLWNAIILHARWARLVRVKGLMMMAIFGNVITSFSWFGVNLMGVGLHSYGFMEGTFLWLVAFMLSQLVLIVITALRPLPES